jgi:hypothetical protein
MHILRSSLFRLEFWPPSATGGYHFSRPFSAIMVYKKTSRSQDKTSVSAVERKINGQKPQRIAPRAFLRCLEAAPK